MDTPALVLDLLIAFNLGLASQLHCVGMCSGIVGALALGLPPATRTDWARRGAFALASNGGRILAYATAGAVLAVFAGALLPAGTRAHTWMRIAAALVLVASGLSLAGMLPRFAVLERAGLPLWRRVQPVARRLLPITSWPRAFAFGYLWGWLPCALVYASLLFAATRAEPLAAAAIMLAFGAGTLPLMVAGAWFAATTPRWCRQPAVRRFAGVALIGLGLAYPFIGPAHPLAAAPGSAPPVHHAH